MRRASDTSAATSSPATAAKAIQRLRSRCHGRAGRQHGACRRRAPPAHQPSDCASFFTVRSRNDQRRRCRRPLHIGRRSRCHASAAGRMPAVAAQLDLVLLFLAVLAAVLAEFAPFGHRAVTGRMGAFVGVCHLGPPSAKVTLRGSKARARSNDWTAQRRRDAGHARRAWTASAPGASTARRFRTDERLVTWWPLCAFPASALALAEGPLRERPR